MTVENHNLTKKTVTKSYPKQNLFSLTEFSLFFLYFFKNLKINLLSSLSYFYSELD